jgi:hypothetical protein
MAADTSAADKLEALAAKLADNAQRLRDGRSATPEEHEELVGTLKQAQEAVYLPRDDLAAMQLGFVTAAAVRLLIHWKVFEKMPDTGSITYEELAARVGGDVVIISKHFRSISHRYLANGSPPQPVSVGS